MQVCAQQTKHGVLKRLGILRRLLLVLLAYHFDSHILQLQSPSRLEAINHHKRGHERSTKSRQSRFNLSSHYYPSTTIYLPILHTIIYNKKEVCQSTRCAPGNGVDWWYYNITPPPTGPVLSSGQRKNTQKGGLACISTWLSWVLCT